MNPHLSDTTLREFAANTLSAKSLLAADHHLAGCEDCRERLVRLGGANARLSELESDLLALENHLSEEDIQRYAGGDLDSRERAELDQHLSACSSCAAEVRDLKEWIAARTERFRPHYIAAAAVVLTFIGVFAAGRWFSTPVVAGLDSLPVGARARVESVIRAGVAEPPGFMEELRDRPEALMGGTERPAFRLLEPLQIVVVSDRPQLLWEALPGAESYDVAVLDAERLEPVSQGTAAGTSWTPGEALPRGRAYVWQVTAHRGDESLTVPAPPSPMARFRVMDADAAEAIERVSRENPEAHFLLGLLYTLSGARAEAESHLERVPPTDPHFDTAKRTLERLRAP